MNRLYCLDTYALSEIHKGNPNFTFLLDKEIIITNLTLSEFYGILLREYNIITAEFVTKQFLGVMKEISFETLKKAVAFKQTNKKNNISFFDAQGYVFAQEKGYEFVTGDKQFKGMKGVLFVK